MVEMNAVEVTTAEVRVAALKPAIPVAWTFMSEILTGHRRIAERLSRHNNLRFDRVSWQCDGHECPSYLATIVPPSQPNLTHLQATLKSKQSYLDWGFSRNRIGRCAPACTYRPAM